MPLFPLKSIVTVLSTEDFGNTLAWYEKWLGTPDFLPVEGTAEWRLGSGVWLQLDSENKAAAGTGQLIVGVNNLAETKQLLAETGIATGDTLDYGFILISAARDPAGNLIIFAEETATE